MWRRDFLVDKPVPTESQIPQSKPPVEDVPVNKSSVKVVELSLYFLLKNLPMMPGAN